MNRHVEVIRLERISHLPKRTQGIIPVCLLEAKRLLRFAAFLKVEWKDKEHYSGLVVHLSRLGLFPVSRPEPSTWGTSSLLSERRAEEGSGRKCGSCRHSRRTVTGGPLPHHCHKPDTRPDPPAEKSSNTFSIRESNRLTRKRRSDSLDWEEWEG